MSSYRNLSKSKYLNGIQCLKALWITLNDPSRIPQVDEATQSVFDQGHLVGELAQTLFRDGISINRPSISENIRDTRAALSLRKPLFEAGFSASHLFCRVDVLDPSGEESWDINEVKSTSEIRDEHLHDVAFQRHCCILAGLEVDRCRIIYLNRDFVKKGEIDPAQLFISEDVTDRLAVFTNGIEERIAEMLETIASPDCPDAAVGQRCNTPYPCVLQEECWAHLPENHVMTLYYGKKLGEGLFSRGILGISDIPSDVKLNPKQQIQKDCVVLGQPHVDRNAIRTFLARLEYPLYFMDFETFMTAIPIYDGTHPYQSIPFQFSVHVVRAPGSIPKHFPFLAEGKGDPRPEFLSRLQKALGNKGTILVYFEAFEKARLKELAAAFPSSQGWVTEVIERIEDLHGPFRDFSYYHPSQGGSASLKKVMPAVTGIGYENLEISQGEIASLRYIQATFGEISVEERQKIREDLLTYCGQDTGGMVSIIDKLTEESRRLL
jgi:hypothetical protein